jgi:hypothetical protein
LKTAESCCSNSFKACGPTSSGKDENSAPEGENNWTEAGRYGGKALQVQSAVLLFLFLFFQGHGKSANLKPSVPVRGWMEKQMNDARVP